MTLRVSSLTSGAATRSPIHETFIYKSQQQSAKTIRFHRQHIHSKRRQNVAYLGRRNSPNLEIIRPHENLCNSLADIAHIPLIKVARLVSRRAHTGFKRGVNYTVHALYLFVCVEHGNVVLERVGDPLAAETHVGDALVLEPVFVLWEGFVEDVVKVLVVGEDDVAADVKELLFV